ncbi:MAG TPA: response regulator [Dehalococcoidia bacterium]|nr:response regulator [Dehalococcoidia bacterium]
MTGHPRRILVIESDAAVRQFLFDLLSEEGHRVESVASVPAARGLLRSWQPDLLLTDLSPWVAQLDELPLLLSMEERLRDLPVVVCTAALTAASEQLPAHAPGLELVRKPFNVDDLLGAIERLAGRQRDTEPGGGGAD